MKLSQDVKVLIGVGIVTVIIVVIAVFTVGNKPSKSQEQEVLSESQVKMLIRKDAHMIGSSKADVNVVEFGDFQCPACGIAYQVVSQIKKEYNGKINFVFREYPIMSHKYGYLSALAAEAAGGQGKFWEMYDKLYSNQKEWSDKNDVLEIFVTYAKGIGIDSDKFKKDVENKTYDSRIQTDIADGNQLGVSSTPTFFINGKAYAGALQYDDFKRIIENELKNK